jgi:hypothetical protein
LGANEFYENAGAWGIQPIAESNGTWLYLLTGRAAAPPGISISFRRDTGASAGAYDDTDPRVILHSAWTRDTQFQEAYGHTVSYSNMSGASISLAFTGRSISYVHTRSFNRGIAEVWIDDRLRDRLDLFSPTTEWKTQTRYDTPDSGTHVLRIRVTGEHGPRASDSFVDLDALIVE